MRLPAYTGPFPVTCIDLEIPAREPRYFASGVVGPDILNAKGKKKGQKKQDSAKVKITRKDDVSHSEDAQVGKENGDGKKEGENDPNEKEGEGGNEFDPFKSKKSTSTLHFDTVLFTIYAPSSVTKEQAKKYSKAAWVGRPKVEGINALFRYIGQYGGAAIPASPALLTLASASIPALVGAPLADPSDERVRAPPPVDREDIGIGGTEPPQFPVIFFTHGLAGNRLSYSQFCGEIASHGIVVAAIEHRDGSGISSTVRHRDRQDKNRDQNQNNDNNRPIKGAVPYLVFERIGMRSFAPDATEEEFGLRQSQLEMRKAEILECKHIMERISKGEGAEVASESTRKLGSKLADKKFKLAPEHNRNLNSHPQDLASWKGKLDLKFPMLVGHSFGGATTFQMQQGDSPFPIAMALDPWVEPLLTQEEREKRAKEKQGEQESSSQSKGIRAPIYIFNSEGFTVWSEHFDKLKTLCAEAREANDENRGWLMTLTGCHHLDFSDYPFLLPHIFRSTVGPQHTIRMFSRATCIQFGLARQSFRERANLPGVKVEEDGTIIRDEEIQGEPQDSKEEETNVEQKPKREESKRRGTDQRVIRRDTVINGPLVQEPEEVVSHQKEIERAKPPIARRKPLFRRKRTVERQEALAREQKAREEAGYRGTVAKRTASGSALVGRRRNTDDQIIFGEHAEDVLADPDAEEIHQQLQDISDSLDYKKNKVHSLMSLMFRWRGVEPGLDRPGKVLIHQY